MLISRFLVVRRSNAGAFSVSDVFECPVKSREQRVSKIFIFIAIQPLNWWTNTRIGNLIIPLTLTRQNGFQSRMTDHRVFNSLLLDFQQKKKALNPLRRKNGTLSIQIFFIPFNQIPFQVHSTLTFPSCAILQVVAALSYLAPRHYLYSMVHAFTGRVLSSGINVIFIWKLSFSNGYKTPMTACLRITGRPTKLIQTN